MWRREKARLTEPEREREGAVLVSHGVPQEEQEPAGAEPRVCDPESRRYGVVFGHDYPPRPDVRGTVCVWTG